MAEITLLKREQIDVNAWDDCIHNASKPLVYASSWYLDAICDNQWCGLVYDNYQAVMPLPTKTRWAIPIVYQPFFCQQLGVFSQTPNPTGYSAFLQKIPFTFLKVGLHLNNSQAFPPGIKTKTNFLLNLHDDYDVLFSRFTSDARKNIRQAKNAGVIISESADFRAAIELYKNTWGPANPLILDKHYKRFEKACSIALEQQSMFCVEAHLNENLLGKAIFLKNHRYLHYVCAAPTPEGKKWGIMHSIINFAIQQHANSPMILDFEGSEIPGVADFYKKFNPVEERYAVYSRMLF